MKKIKFLGLVAIVLMLVACNNGNEYAQGDGSNKNTDEQNLASEPNVDEGSSLVSEGEDNMARVMVFSTGPFQGVQNENGFYFLDLPFNQLKYIDFATRQEIYLTNRPDMAVSGEIESEMSTTPQILGLDGDILYMITRGAGETSGGADMYINFDADGEANVTSGVDIPSALYQMSLDGSNVRQLHQFEVAPNVAILIGDELYYSSSEMACDFDENWSLCTGMPSQIRRVNIVTGEHEILFVSEVEDFNLIGIYENQLLIQRSDFIGYEENFERWREMMNQVEMSMFTYHITTREVTDLIDFSWRYQFLLHEHQLFFITPENHTIYYLDLNTSQREVLAENVMPGGLQGVHQGYLFYTLTTDDPFNWEEGVINLATRNVISPRVTHDTYIVTILGEIDELLLVNLTVPTPPGLGESPDNPMTEADLIGLPEPRHAFISIDDFLRGNFNFQDINRLN